jgi:hypothetical protein
MFSMMTMGKLSLTDNVLRHQKLGHMHQVCPYLLRTMVIGEV